VLLAICVEEGNGDTDANSQKEVGNTVLNRSENCVSGVNIEG
jgi:hypothetical protein